MAILNIIKDNEPDLRRVSKPVEHINRRITTLLDDMRETLESAGGVGLAAPQVGILRRVFIVANIEENDNEVLELINPEIIASSGEANDTEGCLSFPGQMGYVSRPESVTIRAQNRSGEVIILTREGLAARAFCHEMDHLNGEIFFDKAERMLTKEEIEQLTDN